jgi:vacuolar-type H+-ATPase subunit I/STV1
VTLETSIARNATLTGADKVDFDEASSHPIAIFEVAAKTSVDRPVHSVEGLERSTRFAALSSAKLAEMAASASLDPGDRMAATEAGIHLHEAEDDAAKSSELKAAIAELQKDLERVRGEAHAIAGEHAAAAQANPFVARLVSAEDKLGALRKQLADFERDGKTKREAAKLALGKLKQ